MSTHLVFTYGTLKRGYGNHRLLTDARFVNHAMTYAPFHVVCVGFPVAFKSGPDMRRVIGEVYEVTDEQLARLDQLEGVPRHYQRERVRVAYLGAGSQTVWMYVQQDARRGYVGSRPCPTMGDTYEWSHA
jgi:gamma-glutamylaminecyclotransferase